jgi:hypothetical protein
MFKKYKAQIRSCNAIFAMTSMSEKVDHKINDRRGPYIFKLNGQNHHRIGTLLPADGLSPNFAQLYFDDTENEVSNRINALNQSDNSHDSSIVDALVRMLDELNLLVKNICMARDHFSGGNTHHLRLRLIGSWSIDGRVQNLPTCSEIAAIVIGDIGLDNTHSDVIVDYKEGGLQRIN